MDNTKAISFWQFLEKYKIEIPIIQRDYAQGRKGKEELRRSFLTNLKQALDNALDNPEGKDLKLDFVYGAINNNTLTSLDGQQRLTTLWLLHWYVALRAGKLEEAQEVLKKFTYETRVSSREFCEQLCNYENFKCFQCKEDSKIVEFITNQTWFYSAWKQDPTIQSMLRMLSGTKETDKSGNDFIDGIEELFKETTYFTEYWNILSGDDCPIAFYHLPLENFGLSDDLYIKMNARGKQLTDFENLKADLIGYIQENKWEIQNDIAIKFDTTWTDLFWENKNNENEIDDIYFTFLNRFFWNELFIAKNGNNYILDIGKGDETSTQENNNVSYKYLNKIDEKVGQNNNTERFYQGLDKYKYYTTEIPPSFFEKLKRVFDNYISHKGELEEYECKWNENFSFIPKYDEKGEILTLNQRERIVFYAICKYLDRDELSNTKESFNRWMRVIWNLVSGEDNSGKPNIRSTSAMRNAIEFIEKLDPYNVYCSLIGKTIEGNSEFDERCKEEIEKARKIISDKTWEQAIKDAENLLFFKGTIRFLFRNEEEEKVDWSEFFKKWKQAKEYFEKNGIKIKEDYKVKLTKALVLQCEDEKQIYDKQIFNPNASTWLWILSSKDYQKAVHNILMNDNIDKLLESLNNNSNTLDLNGTSLNLINLPYKEMIEIPKGRFRYNNKLLGYYEPYGRDAITFDNKRNEILSNLCNNGKITTENRINNTTFFWGWDIDFTYKEKQFCWKSDNNVCLKDNETKTFKVDDKINKDNFIENNFIKELGELLKSDNSN